MSPRAQGGKAHSPCRSPRELNPPRPAKWPSDSQPGGQEIPRAVEFALPVWPGVCAGTVEVRRHRNTELLRAVHKSLCGRLCVRLQQEVAALVAGPRVERACLAVAAGDVQR